MTSSATLLDYRHRPLTRAVPCADAPFKAVFKTCDQRIAEFEHNRLNANEGAQQFYLLNHAVSEIRARRDPDEYLAQPEIKVLDRYYEVGTDLAHRLFTYMLFICIRESRHVEKATAAPHWQYVRETWSQEVWKFWGTILRCHQSEWLPKAMSAVPEHATLGDITGLLRWVFADIAPIASSYGGAGWRPVSQVLDQFVQGEITTEILVDTAWSLEHNGGSIFNKGYGFRPGGSDLRRTLDAQAKGIMPSYLTNFPSHLPVAVGHDLELVQDALPHLDYAQAPASWHGMKQAADTAQVHASKDKVWTPKSPKITIEDAPGPQHTVCDYVLKKLSDYPDAKVAMDKDIPAQQYVIVASYSGSNEGAMLKLPYSYVDENPDIGPMLDDLVSNFKEMHPVTAVIAPGSLKVLPA